MRLLAAALIAVGLGTLSHPVLAGSPVPAPPQYYVLDEPHILSDTAKRQIEYLLIEHDRATGDQIVLAIFDSIGSDELVTRTTEVFKEWKIGKRGKDNGVLIVAYLKEHLLRIEVGYGLEPQLTDAKSKDVIEDILKPRLRADDVDGAFLSAVQSILTTLESPLLQNPDAAPYLKEPSAPRKRTLHASRQSGSLGWFSALILIFTFGSILWNWIIAAEARFTRAGWSPYRRGFKKRRGVFLGGTGLGGWGGSSGGSGWGSSGGGGFSGGGGSSGGGGASGSW